MLLRHELQNVVIYNVSSPRWDARQGQLFNVGYTRAYTMAIIMFHFLLSPRLREIGHKAWFSWPWQWNGYYNKSIVFGSRNTCVYMSPQRRDAVKGHYNNVGYLSGYASVTRQFLPSPLLRGNGYKVILACSRN